MVKPNVRYGEPEEKTFRSGATIFGQKSNQKKKNQKRAEKRGRKIRKVAATRRKSDGDKPDSDSKPLFPDGGTVKNFWQATPRVFPEGSSIKKRRNVAGRRKSEGDVPESNFKPPLRSILRKTAVLPTTPQSDESEDNYQVRNYHRC